ncbi:hypothetical protein GPECTOR_24g285 [Gonium pectorale]|uniref:Mitochondrial inner membrane protease ATP23 n=1 Tax=Gonium pectorale TaxID=33097 RepID=A0A150GHA3_GONPE|nr:hypothetical protein GPECTOR_24g285 [Gonium pectorale]|eukprot:KXZ48995.1 hypothetical protein GPECTOR_24g285 [Gonium pectorale]
MTRSDVAEAVDYGLAADRPVRTLIDAMTKLGCPVDRSAFHVLRCDAAVGGGFAPGHGVILCHNRLHTRREVWNAMAHELIHAYDHCRAAAPPPVAAAEPLAAPAVAEGGPVAAPAPAWPFASAAADAGGDSGVAAAAASDGGEGGVAGAGGRSGGLDWSNCYHHACTEPLPTD